MKKQATHLLPTLLAVRDALAQGSTDLLALGARYDSEHDEIHVKVKDKWASFHAKDLETIIRNMEAGEDASGPGLA